MSAPVVSCQIVLKYANDDHMSVFPWSSRAPPLWMNPSAFAIALSSVQVSGPLADDHSMRAAMKIRHKLPIARE